MLLCAQHIKMIMPLYFHKSSEGIKEYEEIKISYPDDNLTDKAYEVFMEKTKKCPESKRKREIMNMTRIVVDSKEYIVYDEMLRAEDGIGNPLHHFRGGMGRYPIPIPEYELRQIPGTLDVEKATTGIRDIKVGHSIPFNAKNADALYKDCQKEGDHQLPLELG
jgi:hypothetical protein